MKKLFYMILFGILIMCFSKCKTAAELTDKALSKDSATVIKKVRDIAPCVSGVIRITDSADYKKWQKALAQTVNFYDSLLDNVEPQLVVQKDLSDSMKVIVLTANVQSLSKTIGILQQQAKNVKPLVQRPPAIHDTIPVKDMADVWLANKERNAVKEDNLKKALEIKNLEKIAFHRGIENWIWRLIATFFIVLWVWKKYKQFTTIKIR